MRATLTHATVRQLLLALVVIGIVGLEVELALLRHAESFSQWIPHVTLFIGLLTTAAVVFRAGPRTLKVFQVMMIVFLVVGALGVYFHLNGNVEFAEERDPSLSGVRLLWKALRGASPALAPGALAQLGLLGLLYGYKHPAITRDNTIGRESVD
jgi:Na+-driven multidrug efflux pump